MERRLYMASAFETDSFNARLSESAENLRNCPQLAHGSLDIGAAPKERKKGYPYASSNRSTSGNLPHINRSRGNGEPPASERLFA